MTHLAVVAAALILRYLLFIAKELVLLAIEFVQMRIAKRRADKAELAYLEPSGNSAKR